MSLANGIDFLFPGILCFLYSEVSESWACFPQGTQDFPLLYLFTPTAGNQHAQHWRATGTIWGTRISNMFGFAALLLRMGFPSSSNPRDTAGPLRSSGFLALQWGNVSSDSQWGGHGTCCCSCSAGSRPKSSISLGSSCWTFVTMGTEAHYWPLPWMFFKIYWLFKIRFEGHLLYFLRNQVDFCV